MSETTKVKKCTCVHEFQDKVYGLFITLMNKINKPKPGSEWRCTVCGKEHG